MERKLYKKLTEWQESLNRKPLLLNGARQVGKTYLLKEFGRREFRQVVYINLDADKTRFGDIFADSIHPTDIIARLEILEDTKITPEDTLIIFDEVQEIPRALTSLKYFYEEAPEYFVAASGSLLGVALSAGTSFPVGKVDMLELEPLDFEEFLMATGNGRLLNLSGDWNGLKIFADKFEMLFRQYLIVGGMPEAVAHWASNQDYAEVDKIQNAILLAYLNDISKHTDKNTATRIHQVWQSLPAQFAKRNGKFQFGLIKEGARGREYDLAIQWLVDCHIVRKVERVKTGDKLPLKAYTDSSSFKLYFLDVGLFRHLAGVTSAVIIDDELIFREFSGFFAEQFVLQQLSANYQLYYWDSDATAEVDFITSVQDKIIPIEVKSGTNVKAKSLKVYREKYQPALSLRFSLKELEHNDGLVNVPLYFIVFLAAILQENDVRS